MLLLERETQQNELESALKAAATGHGRTVLISGEAGIGKTALVGAFRDAIGHRARVLVGACEALFTPRPLGPFYDVIHAAGGALALRLSNDAKPIDLFHDVLTAIREHSIPTVVVLEDMHWADHATLDFVRFLGRRIDGTQGLLVLTYRDDEAGADHPLTAVLGELPPAGRMRLKLPPLSRAIVESLARDAGRAGDDLYRVTGGNPFFVSEALAVEAGRVAPNVREAVLARASHLPAPARAMLDLASVVPDRVVLTVLERASNSNSNDIDACVERGLLAFDAGQVFFRHELARLAIEQALSPIERVRLNLRILGVLAEAPNPDAALLTRLAHHAVAAHDAQAIVRYAPQAAAVASARGAHREAATLIDATIPYASALSVRERAGFYEQAATAYLLVAQGERALAMNAAAYERWAELADPIAMGRNRVRRCMLIWSVRTHALRSVGEIGAEAVDLLEGTKATDELALARWWCAIPETFGTGTSGVAHRDALARLATTSTVARTCIDAWILISIAEYHMSGAPRAESVERLVHEARSAGDDLGVMMGFSRRAWALSRDRDLAGLERCIADGQAFARDRQLEHFLPSHAIDQFAADVAAARGRWAAAEDLYGSLAKRNTLPIFFRVPYCLPPLNLIRARLGKPYDVRWADEFASSDAMLFHFEVYPIQRALAEIAWLSGDVDTARASAQKLAAIADAWKHPWALGEAAVWQRLAGIETDLAGEIASPYARALAGDSLSAAQLWRERGYVYEAALALALGDAGAQREAVRSFEDLGATAAAERVRELLRARGERGVPLGPRASTRANAAGLTEREQLILRLVAAGLSNAEIALRLHRSVRTVEHHVTAIIDKLGADNRQRAVAAARRAGLIGP